MAVPILYGIQENLLLNIIIGQKYLLFYLLYFSF